MKKKFTTIILVLFVSIFFSQPRKVYQVDTLFIVLTTKSKVNINRQIYLLDTINNGFFPIDSIGKLKTKQFVFADKHQIEKTILGTGIMKDVYSIKISIYPDVVNLYNYITLYQKDVIKCIEDYPKREERVKCFDLKKYALNINPFRFESFNNIPNAKETGKYYTKEELKSNYLMYKNHPPQPSNVIIKSLNQITQNKKNFEMVLYNGYLDYLEVGRMSDIIKENSVIFISEEFLEPTFKNKSDDMVIDKNLPIKFREYYNTLNPH